ncbi:MAG: sulfatase [Lentisphaerales bacterium]|nr:sulfatase [Lentisphaerales bacterium]
MSKMRLILISCFMAMLVGCAVDSAADKPNFIVIFTDDQGYNDLSCFGSKKIKTPHIDSIAKDGRKFTSFYVASPVCSPSRAALLTGCYPKRIGMEKHVIFPANKHGMHKDEVTIADLLHDNGYATACVGKWHLGHEKPFLPTSQGFDCYFGIPYSNDMSHPDNKKKPRGIKSDDLWKDQKTDLLWNTPLMIDEEIAELPVNQRTITRRYTNKAIDFVKASKDKPFFLYLPHSMPHIPLYVPDDFYDPDPANAYTNVIEHIDTEVGRLLQTVTELGLDENTYIIFTTDNGPWLPFKNHGGSALPLRDGKGTTYEGGQRVPCVMKGPGIPAGSETAEIMTTMDLLPTIAKLAGVELKTRGEIDGIDASQLMLGAEKSPRNEFVYYSSRGELNGLRQGDFKLRIAKPRKKRGQKGPIGAATVELYNLKNDISEKANLAEKMPEKVKVLKARMVELDQEISKAIRPRGQVE